MHKILKSTFAILCLSFVFSLTSQTATAQTRSTAYSNALTADPISLLIARVLNAQYEWKTSTTNSLAVRGLIVPSYSSYSAFGLGGSYRFYIADSRALSGLSVGPSLDLLFFSSSSLDRTATIASIGGEIQYKWIFSQFVLEPNLNVRFFLAGNEGVGNAFSGVGIGLGVNLGYAW